MGDNQLARDLIVALRGGVPSKCDFCGSEVPESLLEPEEAGEWVCHTCMLRWEMKDRVAAEARIRELESRLRDYEQRYGELGREGA